MDMAKPFLVGSNLVPSGVVSIPHVSQPPTSPFGDNLIAPHPYQHPHDIPPYM